MIDKWNKTRQQLHWRRRRRYEEIRLLTATRAAKSAAAAATKKLCCARLVARAKQKWLWLASLGSTVGQLASVNLHLNARERESNNIYSCSNLPSPREGLNKNRAQGERRSRRGKERQGKKLKVKATAEAAGWPLGRREIIITIRAIEFLSSWLVGRA